MQVVGVGLPSGSPAPGEAAGRTVAVLHGPPLGPAEHTGAAVQVQRAAGSVGGDDVEYGLAGQPVQRVTAQADAHVGVHRPHLLAGEHREFGAHHDVGEVAAGADLPAVVLMADRHQGFGGSFGSAAQVALAVQPVDLGVDRLSHLSGVGRAEATVGQQEPTHRIGQPEARRVVQRRVEGRRAGLVVRGVRAGRRQLLLGAEPGQPGVADPDHVDH